MYHNYSFHYKNVQNVDLTQYTVEIKYIGVVGEDKNILQKLNVLLSR